MRSLLLITSSYPASTADGKEAAGSFVSDLAEELTNHMRVTVLAPAAADSSLTVGNLSIRRFAGPGKPLSLLSPLNPAHWRKIFSVVRQGMRAAEDLARQQRFDHTLALWTLPAGYWARKLKQRFSIPYSVWALGSDIWTLGKIPVIRWMLRTVLRESTACFADGHLLRQDVERLCGRACDFLPSVRRLPFLGGKRLRDSPPYRLAYLGRWHPNKGVDLLLESLTFLDDKDWNKIETIRICGGGPLEPLVRSRATELSSSGRPISIHGYLDKNGAAELLTWADYLIVPSRIESIPVIFSDAMKSQCPVISTPAGDLPRLINEYRVGVLSSEISAASFADAIRAALTDNPLGFDKGLAAAALNFDIEKVVHRVIAAVESSD